jgi:DNA invertase Pin-like site-specific DNA recombinase
MKAIGYFREPPSGVKGESLAAQNKAFLAFCDERGYDVAVTFVETLNGLGGGHGFRQLVDYLRKAERGFVLVVARAMDALGADMIEAVRRFYQLQGLGAQVAFIDGPDDPTEALMSAWPEQSERSKLGERVRAAMRRKAVRGEVLGRPPYGYKVGMRRRLELVPEEAVVVRYLFRLYLHEGMGIRLIARRLNEEGNRTRRGGNWSMVSIRDILRNRVYLGTYSRFGVRVPGSHPALVTPDDFRAVQDRLNARRNNYGKRQPSPFLLAGLVQCGHCGNKMIGVSRKQSWRRRSGSEGRASYRYYQCESRTNQSVCDYHTQRADELEEQVRSRLASLDVETFALDGSRNGDLTADLDVKSERLRTRIRQLDGKLEEQIAAAAKGRLGREQLNTMNTTTAMQRLKLEEELEAIERRVQEQNDAHERTRTRQRALATLLDGWATLSLDEKKTLLRGLVDRVVVRDEGMDLVLQR